MATHNVTIDRLMRPGGQRLRAVRRRREGATGCARAGTPHPARSPRARSTAGPAPRSGRRSRPRRACPPARRSPTRPAPAATPQPDASWSAWQPVGAGGAIASPAARYIQYRARMTSTAGVASPTLQRVQISFGAGADRAPVAGHGHGRAGLAQDEPDAHRDAERVQRPRRRPAHLPLPLVPQRHGDPRRHVRHARPRRCRQRRPRRRDPRRGLRDRRQGRGQRRRLRRR